MHKIDQLHDQAMRYAQEAFVAALRQDRNAHMELSLRAFECESQAAQLATQVKTFEPTRSILLRSAATLAVDCGLLREAEKLIAVGLSGDAPEHIAEELRDLYETVSFQRHLRTSGVELNPDEFQMSITGSAVGHGITESEAFVDRLQNMEKLIIRTVERSQGLPFRRSGPSKKEIQTNFGVYLSVPRAASFAVTIRFSTQSSLELGDRGSPEQVIDEVIDNLELYNDLKEESLRKRIEDIDYYDSFIGLAKRISPDGDKVTLVGLTAKRGGYEREVALRRSRPRIEKKHDGASADLRKVDEIVVLKGTLKFADSLSDSKIIMLEEDSGQRHRIVVSEGLMADVVRPFYEDTVIVEARRRGRSLLLTNIDKA